MTRVIAVLILGCLAACDSSTSERVLIAASNMKHPPFSSWSVDGRAVGLEVEIVERAAHELGYEVTWVERPFSELLVAIEAGEIDIAVSTIGITDERKTRVALSDPYYETQIVALVRSDELSPTSLDALANATIGADEGTTSYPAARRQWPSATLVGQVQEGMTWLQMLDQKIIDAFVVDASDQRRLESDSGIKVAKIQQPLSTELFAVATSLGNTNLQTAINQAIK
jgi:polar amino acid transport system substrate-binding protein